MSFLLFWNFPQSWMASLTLEPWVICGHLCDWTLPIWAWSYIWTFMWLDTPHMTYMNMLQCAPPPASTITLYNVSFYYFILFDIPFITSFVRKIMGNADDDWIQKEWGVTHIMVTCLIIKTSDMTIRLTLLTCVYWIGAQYSPSPTLCFEANQSAQNLIYWCNSRQSWIDSIVAILINRYTFFGVTYSMVRHVCVWFSLCVVSDPWPTWYARVTQYHAVFCCHLFWKINNKL